MAYELLRASSQRIDTASAFSATGVQSMHFNFRLRSLPPGDSFPNRYKIVASSNSLITACPYLVLGTSNTRLGFYESGNYREFSVSATYVVGVWYSIVAVWDFLTTTASLKLFLGGSQIGSTYTAARGTPSIQAITSLGGDGFNEAGDLHLANFGFWNAELTAAEIASLACGFSPKKIRPQSLLRDIPLIRVLQDNRLSTSVTPINSPTVSVHPPTYQ